MLLLSAEHERALRGREQEILNLAEKSSSQLLRLQELTENLENLKADSEERSRVYSREVADRDSELEEVRSWVQSLREKISTLE